MDVQLPDGTVIKDIPEGTTKADLTAKLRSNGYDVSKLEAPAPDYGNEGRREPAQKPEHLVNTIGRAVLGESLGPLAGDVMAGLNRAGAGAARFGEDLVRGRNPLTDTPELADVMLAEKTGKPAKRGYLTQTLSDDAADAYKDAGPVAGLTNFAANAALTSAPSNLAGKAAQDTITKMLPRAAVAGSKNVNLASAVNGAVAGATSGALLPPEEGSTRAENALQGALGGTVGRLAIGGIGDAVNAGREFMRTGSQAALARAAKLFEKNLKPGEMASVTNNVQLPQEVPMSTAAAAGSPKLAAFEKTARGTDTTGKWEALDERTKAAAWDKTGEALQGSIADLQPRQLAVKEAMKPAQEALDRIKFKEADKDGLILSLTQLAKKSDFNADSQASRELNRVIADATGPGVTLGGLANLDTNLATGSSKYKLDDRQMGMVRDIVRSKIDSLSNGAWSKAHADLAAARVPLERSEAANAVYGDFSDAFGGARGKTSSGSPELTATKLANSVIRRGTDATDKLAPRDVMDPVDREQIGHVVDALRRAEYPKTASVAAAKMPGVTVDARGNPTPLDNNVWSAVRYVADKMLGSRNEATRRAADVALRSGQGWQKMLDAAQASKEISASDAATLAAILRGAGPVAGSASQ